jgi:hypothetical protein
MEHTETESTLLDDLAVRVAERLLERSNQNGSRTSNGNGAAAGGTAAEASPGPGGVLTTGPGSVFAPGPGSVFTPGPGSVRPPLELYKLSVAGVEQTQATQFFRFNGQGSGAATDNSVPLIANKTLVLRVYVDYFSLLISGADTLQITGSVTCERVRLFQSGSTPLPDATPINAPTLVMPSSAIQRGQAGATLNFLVPASSCEGIVRFRIKVWDIANPDFQSQTKTQYVGFGNVPLPRVHGVLIHYKGTNASHSGNLDIAAPTGSDLVATLAPMIRLYPISGIDYTGCDVIDFDGDLTTPLPSSGCGTGWDQLMTRLGNMRSGSGTNDVYVGLLPNFVPLGGVSGCGGNGVAISSVNESMTFAQEIGHAFNRKHAPCGKPGDPDANYPTYGSYPSGSIGEFGYDVGTNQVFDPSSTFDIMSYCGPTWISPYTYMGLKNGIAASAAASSTARPHTRDHVMEQLHLNVRIRRDGGVELLPSFHLAGPAHTDIERGPASGVDCDLVNADGTVLSTHECHLLSPRHCSRGPSFDVSEVLPWSGEVESIVFRRGDVVLDTIRVGRPPSLSLRNLRVEHGIVLVDWSARAAGGELEPTCLVRYSNDDGDTWRAVAADLTSTRHGISLNTIPGGSHCRVQVVATSGIATATVESEPFEVERKPRQAYMINPPEPLTVTRGQVVPLVGAGFSPDHGPAPFDDVRWSSSLDGNLGAGYEVATASLSVGFHLITLAVPDGEGGVATATTQVTVENTERRCT